MSQRNKRLLFTSPHCLVDFASGAAIATWDALELLARRGFECTAFCASKFDSHNDEPIERLLADLQLSGSSTNMTIGDDSVRLLRASRGRMPVSIFPTLSPRIDDWAPDEPQAMLAAYDQILGDFRPDVLLTYGGHPAALDMMRLAKERRIPVVFGLHNFAYHDARVFQNVDYVIVPSEFSARWYEQRLGLNCHVLPYATDWTRVESRETTPARRDADGVESQQKYVTFVNPQPTKGVFVFARIAEQLQRRRPEIPILVVESRGAASWLEQTGLDMSWCQNLHAMENTHDPRDFYRVTKLLLVPSLWNESFGLVAAEAMINGIPVLASDRGALPEVVGKRSEGRSQRSGVEETESGGVLFHIPDRYTPETASVPTAEEVEPWVETIIRLWDDESLYRECSEKALAHAQQWHPDRLGPVYEEFFRKVRPQPGPPLLRGQLSGLRACESFISKKTFLPVGRLIFCTVW